MKIENLNDYLKTNVFLSTDFETTTKNYLFFLLSIVCILFILAFILPVENSIDAFVIFSPKNEISTLEVKTSGKIVINNIEMGKDIFKGDILIKLDTEFLENERQLCIEQLETNENEKNKYEILMNYINGDKSITNHLTELYELKEMQYKQELEQINKNIEDEQSLPLFAQTPSIISDLNFSYSNKMNEYLLWKLEQEKETIEKIYSLTANIKDNKISIYNLNEQINLNYLRSPIDGKISVKKNFNIGDFVEQGTSILDIIPTSNYITGNIYISPDNRIDFYENTDVILHRKHNSKMNTKKIKFSLKNVSPYPIETKYGNLFLAKSNNINKSVLGSEYNLGTQYQCTIVKERLTIITYIKKMIYNEL